MLTASFSDRFLLNSSFHGFVTIKHNGFIALSTSSDIEICDIKLLLNKNYPFKNNKHVYLFHFKEEA